MSLINTTQKLKQTYGIMTEKVTYFTTTLYMLSIQPSAMQFVQTTAQFIKKTD
jgi:hypothetical protein